MTNIVSDVFLLLSALGKSVLFVFGILLVGIGLLTIFFSFIVGPMILVLASFIIIILGVVITMYARFEMTAILKRIEGKSDSIGINTKRYVKRKRIAKRVRRKKR